jgi:predicted nucleic acid-binding protein
LKLADKIRLVIDTNILLDIVYFNDQRVQDLKSKIESNELEIRVMLENLGRISRCTSRPQFFKSQEIYYQQLEDTKKYFQFEKLPIPMSAFKCKDKDDQIFIDLAVLKAPCWLLSKDLEVIKLSKRLKNVGVMVSQTINI